MQGLGHFTTSHARHKTFKSYHFTSRGVGAGVYHVAGEYFAPAAHAQLNQAGKTVVLGAADVPYGSHAFVVLSAVGTDDKTTGFVELTVSGTSITDEGVRVATPDTEVIIVDIEAAANITDAYFETSKKWIGPVTFTLDNDATGDAVNFALTFNYGFAKYEDFGNQNFVVNDFECVGEAAIADAAFNIELLKHSSAGWTYSAAAFVAGGTVLYDMNADYVTETDPDANEPIVYKRAMLNDAIDGAVNDGIIVRITTGQNNTAQNLSIHLGVKLL